MSKIGSISSTYWSIVKSVKGAQSPYFELFWPGTRMAKDGED